MSVVSGAERAFVVARAAGRCEYCRLPSATQAGTFPVDHVLPRCLGGPTRVENMALACPHCNGRKWAFVTGRDAATGDELPLFNPRREAWEDHFFWSARFVGLLEGRTPRGRATLDRLARNHPDVVALRRLLNEAGLFPELTPPDAPE